MVVALDETLIDMQIHNLAKEGGWQRVEEGKTTGTDQFIGAGVTRRGETIPNIDLCAEPEALLGFILGYTQHHDNTIPTQGYYYNDFDEPFVAGKWVFIGIPKTLGIYLVLSATNVTILIGQKIKCVDGVFTPADTNDNYQMICEQAIAAAANTRKYFYASFVKN